MSDNLRQYRAIHSALQQWYPDSGNGRIAQHLTTLAALISGIVASRSSHLPAIAPQVPNGTKAESRVKRYTRWVRHEAIDEERYFFPYAKTLLACLALETLVLVIDGSTVGRGCVALMVHVVYKGRALPLGWLVRQGRKGHFSEAVHLELVETVQDMIPWCEHDNWSRVIHRTARCDLSLFQLGLRLLAHFLNENLPIPVRFHIVLEGPKGVR